MTFHCVCNKLRGGGELLQKDAGVGGPLEALDALKSFLHKGLAEIWVVDQQPDLAGAVGFIEGGEVERGIAAKFFIYKYIGGDDGEGGSHGFEQRVSK